jgi:hypothetical protein
MDMNKETIKQQKYTKKSEPKKNIKKNDAHSKAEKRLKYECKRNMAQLLHDSTAKAVFENKLEKWTSIYKQYEAENIDYVRFLQEQDGIFIQLRALEIGYKLPAQYLDRYLTPQPVFSDLDSNNPSSKLSPLQDISISERNTLQEIMRHYHNNLCNDPTPVKELISEWDVPITNKEDVIDLVQILPEQNPFLIEKRIKYKGQKHFILMIRIDAQQNIEFLIPGIKNIIISHREQIVGLPQIKNTDKSKQIEAYNAFKEKKTARKIAEIIGCKMPSINLNQKEKEKKVKSIIAKMKYSINEGKKEICKTGLTNEEKTDISNQARKYFNGRIGKKTYLK